MALGVGDAGGEPDEVPVADGGDGTLDVLLGADPRSRVTRHRVTDPLGAAITARLGWLADGSAVVEMAEASGLRLIGRRKPDPRRATSRGTGELILAALDGGAARIIVGVGGSASTDGGAGLLQALGARFLGEEGRELGPGGAALRNLESIDLSGIDPRLRSVALHVAVDVRNPLLGVDGAAAVFAPQKGARPGDVAFLEAGLDRFALVAERDAGAAGYAATPGSGAAGGAAFGLMLIGAYRAPGAALVCDLVGLDTAIAGASLVLTGEGRLDAQTSWGKAPAEVARRAALAGVPCVAIAGVVHEIPSDLARLFGEVVALAGVAGGADTFAEVATLLRAEAAQAVHSSMR